MVAKHSCGIAHCPVVAGYRRWIGRLVCAFEFRGLGAAEGLGGGAVPDFGRADESVSASVVRETRGDFSKRRPSAGTGGWLPPGGAQNPKISINTFI